jgi:hypothetical protein
VLIFEPLPGRHGEAGEVMRATHARAQGSGWHCWAYRNELKAEEITLFLEGPASDGDAPVFGDEIARLKALAARFEPVRSLIEYPLGGEEQAT